MKIAEEARLYLKWMFPDQHWSVDNYHTTPQVVALKLEGVAKSWYFEVADLKFSHRPLLQAAGEGAALLRRAKGP
jgi:hypothetical protein